MRYAKATKASLLRRLSGYSSYVGCCCAVAPFVQKCRGKDYCARADYRRALSALRKLVKP